MRTIVHVVDAAVFTTVRLVGPSRLAYVNTVMTWITTVIATPWYNTVPNSNTCLVGLMLALSPMASPAISAAC